MGYDTLTVEFDHYWRSYTGTAGYVEVYDGTNWVTIDTMTTTRGSWTAPAHENYNVACTKTLTSRCASATATALEHGAGTGLWITLKSTES